MNEIVLRWSVAIALSAAGFVLPWWMCQKLIHLDEGVSLGIGSAVLTVVLAVTGWWATLGGDSKGPDDARQRLVQKARAGRDVNMAGRDQTIINHRHPDT